MRGAAVSVPGQSAGGSGVGAPSGYTAETGSLARQSQAIHDAAEAAQGEVEGLAPAKVAEADFGTEHGQWAADFTASIEQLGKGAGAMCTALISLATSIGSAGQQYAAAEAEQSSAVAQSGSGM
ncbi:hypothetical protein SacmaDRAFT_0741 [Saccharomonospora marina XMU15]|uniref:WXG repeat protein n=1 Tax=Saccharomonospora marina XMU15 TaxID=882083 RepID=H5X777_9PSEU|nr:hypothetical protein SacmaDRAFT_0741 [Saccharomonospora marina XMU15]